MHKPPPQSSVFAKFPHLPKTRTTPTNFFSTCETRHPDGITHHTPSRPTRNRSQGESPPCRHSVPTTPDLPIAHPNCDTPLTDCCRWLPSTFPSSRSTYETPRPQRLTKSEQIHKHNPAFPSVRYPVYDGCDEKSRRMSRKPHDAKIPFSAL